MLFANAQYLDTGTTVIAQPFSVHTAFEMTAIGKVFDGVTTRATIDVVTANYRIFAGSVVSSAGNTWTNGEDVQITGVFNDTASFLYENGTAIVSNASIGTAAPNVLRIGGNTNATDNFDGYLSEILFVAGSVATAHRQMISRNQGEYFRITVA